MSELVSLPESFPALIALVKARVPLIWMLTHEERKFLEQVFQDIVKAMRVPVYVWSSWQGIVPLEQLDKAQKAEGAAAQTVVPMKALEYINDYRGDAKGTIFVLRDFHTVLQTQEIRMLRDIYDKAAREAKIIIITSPILAHGAGGSKDGLPPTLEKQISVVDYHLPDYNEIVTRAKSLVQWLSSQLDSTKHETKLSYTETEYEEICRAVRGLTSVEIENSFATCLAYAKKLDPRLLLQDKKQVIKRSQVLEYIDTSIAVNDVGGLDNAKNYLIRYTKAFTKEAQAYGVEPLRAVLFTGIPGVGKSLLAKAIGNLWKLPLLRLDVGRVMGSLVGSSEARMREVISTLESIAPCCVWIDEVEKALSGTKSSGATDGGTTSRVFGTLLTAMQDGLKDVVIIATANSVLELPPEFIRRFNEVFFVDVPGPEERWEILGIHLRLRARDIKVFDNNRQMLLDASQGFTGAEIEKAVKDAIAHAFYDDSKDMTVKHLLTAFKETKPIIQVQADKVKELQDWAKGHARYASSYSENVSRDPNLGEQHRTIAF